MKLLDGRELVGYIKERQAKQVRALRQTWHTIPKLAIIVASNNQVIDTYVRLKQSYGSDILIDVDVYSIEQADVSSRIALLNADVTVHGIILQLPLTDVTQTTELVEQINPVKDVDGLGSQALYTSATATAIDWLLAGYNITLQGRTIAIVGNGRLVGAPLAKLWGGEGLDVTVYDSKTINLKDKLREADIIVTATGVPGLITTAMVSPGKTLIDAGTASEDGVVVGDITNELRQRDDLTITPVHGGVGPLTIAALFDNVISAARKSVATNEAPS